jgi:hypothetical protein
MRSYRGLALLSAPVIGAVLLVLALLNRPEGRATVRRTERPLPPKVVATSAPKQEMASARAPVARPPAPKLPEIVVPKDKDEARVMQTYQTYRTAVARGNPRVQAEIRKVLLRDEDLALRVAEGAVAQATNELDREIARKTLEALRR